MEDQLGEKENTEEANTPLNFDNQIKDILAEIGKWGKLVAIVGFVFIGLILIMGFALTFGGSAISKELANLGKQSEELTPAIGISYMVIALVYFFPIRYLYDFSIYVKQAVEFNDQESMVYSFNRLKSLLRFMGIIAIIFIGFYFLSILVGLFAG